MFASPADVQDALRRLHLATEHPYDITHQFRLIATDYEGTEWAGGWTFPRQKETSNAGWLLCGELNSLVTRAKGPWVSIDSGVASSLRITESARID
jgi:hypothetical protein